MDSAAKAYLDALALQLAPAEAAEAHGFVAGWRAAKNDFTTAIKHYRACYALCDPDPALEFELAFALESAGDVKEALNHYLKALALAPNNARHHLFAGAALDVLARHDEALQVWSIGADLDPALRRLKDHPQANQGIRERSRRADKALREFFTAQHQTAVMEFDAPRIEKAIWAQTHNQPFYFQTPQQRPHLFYVPDLPAQPVFSDLDWAPAFDNYWREIRDEYLAIEKTVHGSPYVHERAKLGADWAKLKGSQSWRSIHLYQNGVLDEDIAVHFPKTLRAIQNAPTVKLDGAPLEVFFSVLAPNTKIPHHFGLANSRLTVHLPLIVPNKCALTVAGENYTWREGKILAFDDSFDHAAENSSDEPRVVLIFEAWAPDLSDTERQAIEASFSVRNAWRELRRIPKK